MTRRPRTSAAACAAAALALAGGPVPAGASAEPSVAPRPGAGDAVVVAVIDRRVNPYHHDVAAAHMPQTRDGDTTNDLPLDAAPHTWLPGFPDPAAFDTYEPLGLTLAPDDPDAEVQALADGDAEVWSRVSRSSPTSTSYYWVPGTKVIGLVDFAGNRVRGGNGDHGSKVASTSVGNLHGTCPECLLVFLSFGVAADAEAAIGWALDQPWIDVVVNSYGFNLTSRYRDRIYNGSDVGAQRDASERGQTVFFSAGNGLENDFRAPNTTLFSSQEGPDWIVTVGAVSAEGHEYSGSGKPVDVASVGDGYPSMGGTTVSGAGTFGGTSNATPVVGGLYASALGWARTRLDGPSRTQAGGAVATGSPVTCGAAVPACALGDGVLDARTLRTRLLQAAIATPQGPQVGEGDAHLASSPTPEATLLAEGHGTFFARARSAEQWAGEAERIVGPLDGSAAPLARPEGEREWFVVDSWCRQQLWGTWDGGDWRTSQPLPAPDPIWPARTALTASCDTLVVPP